MPLNDEKIIKYAEAKLEGGEALMLLEEIEETKEKLEETNEKISLLTEEVKKKEAEEVRFEIDPEDIRGEKGDKGERGEKGEKGEKGDKGESGKDGRDGIDGIDGQDGLDGKDGKDGISVVNTKMLKGDLIIELSNGQEINVGKVKGEDGKSVNHYSLMGGGGSASVQIKKDGQLITTSANSINFSGFNVTNQSGNITVTDINTGYVTESLAIAYAIAL